MSNIARTALKGVTYYNPPKADDGYTLFNVFGTKKFFLIDMEGNVVHCWKVPHPAELHGRLLPSGLLAYVAEPKGYDFPLERPALHGAGQNLIMEIDWDSNIVWQAQAPYQSHDFYPFDLTKGDKWPKNGHYIYPAYHPDGIFPDELAKKWRGGVMGTEYQGKIYGDSLYEIDRDGNIVWVWKARDHLDPVLDAFPPYDVRASFHSNTAYLCHDGSILWSGRVLCQVHKIEYPSGKVIGRYGKGELFHQHDCRETPGGNILTLDNGSHRSNRYGPEYSRSVEIDPDTGKVVWAYQADPPETFYTAVLAGSERLPNGNTLICDASNGRFFEVTLEKDLVWEYVFPLWSQRYGMRYSNAIYHAHRYPKDYPAFKGKDLDPARWEWENKTFGPPAWKGVEFKPCIFQL